MEVLIFIVVLVAVISFIMIIKLDLIPFFIARRSKVELGIGEYLLFRLKKLDHRRITKSLIASKKASLDIEKDQVIKMEADNSNSLNVIYLLAAAKKYNNNFPILAAIKGDKAGINYPEVLNKSDDIIKTIMMLKDRLN